ncbi:MAG: transglutaminase family protein [Rhizobiaceae bacterium]|nr:transglutaminase family protein [Hyphomicrobiales bacterium]NRB29041.1 transglutaminase family protein [Rhizobiaceae bacterium]
MELSIEARLNYQAPQPCWVLLQIEAAETPGQKLLQPELQIAGTLSLNRIHSDEGIGERVWLRVDERLDCTYQATAQLDGDKTEIDGLQASALHDLPSDTVKYLLPSRYCSVFEFDDVLNSEFGSLRGGAQIAAMVDWVRQSLIYDPAASNATTTAWQTIQQGRGVCRDFAHVLISLARAAAIPARYASVYSPDAVPMDFHAIVQVFLDGAWRDVDPSGLSQPERNALIGVGRDATDVSFLTSYGDLNFISQNVDVRLV